MPAQPSHGRRRATTVRPKHFYSNGIFDPVRGPLKKRLGAAAAVTGIIAFTALTAAHAESHALSGAKVVSAVVSPPDIQAAVTADAAAALAFDRPAITSQAAPEPPAAPAPAPAVHSSGEVQMPAVPAGQAPAQESKGLRAPLASLKVSSPFGFRTSPITGAASELHTGIDLAGACSTAVFAAASGTVTEAGWSPYGGGNRIVVDHGKGLKTTYNHLASIGVSVGQSVGQSQQIAGVGTTGASTGCHLHFEVMVNGNTVDPSAYI